ncbi:MAG: arginine--tRNA ligase [Candidatus Vogelbacteria bacterium]|nr:arginine--tRNA ligase [Candidatus Vogelbacteria bacterium]
MITVELKQLITKACEQAGFSDVEVKLEHPDDLVNGDYASNVALMLAKQVGQAPKDVAEKIKTNFASNSLIKKIEVAGPGFLNFFLNDRFFTDRLKIILAQGDSYGQNKDVEGYKVMVEYTDPNPFKAFHIGHLMSNSIGEAISRIAEASGAEVKRACYQGDVGMHVAKALYGLKAGQNLMTAYAFGSKAYDENETAKAQIIEFNKKIYNRNDEEINKLYDGGRAESLEQFETIYQKLGTKFDFNFFESEVAGFGKELVEQNIDTVFTNSDGAVVYAGEKDGLHTRVFINSEGLPTYEAKELGLAKIKHDTYPYDYSIVVTANEITEYFKVLLAALKQIYPELAGKTRHVPHGMLRLPTGKMSSRTGEVITAESLIEEVKQKIATKVKEAKKESNLDDATLEQVAIGAIKYSILKQDITKDIIFDLEKSISFEGNSGPYLQYTYARTQSVLAKATTEGLMIDAAKVEVPGLVEKLLTRYPEIVYKAGENLAPHHLTTYLTELASAFNAYYASHKIVGGEAGGYRLALSAAVGQTLKNGLKLLGLATPERM